MPPELENKTSLQQIPSVEKLVENARLESWNTKIARLFRVRMAQGLIREIRSEVTANGICPSESEIVNRLEKNYEAILNQKLRKVINATGIVLHTNLGRAPLGRQWCEEASEVLDGYCDLEFNLRTGERGSRTARLEKLTQVLIGADGAIVVNNNAAALVLILHGLAKGKKAVVSRGELVQIGGGFRIPDIMESSGVRLSEVGTTNITTLRDYEKAIDSDTAVLLKVHQSNFVIEGHTEGVSVKVLSQLARSREIPFIFDLGSGSLNSDDLDLSVTKALDGGADLVCFSGDKLLGGAQAGFIVGGKRLVEKLKESPFYRALRIGKTELFFLEKALHSCLSGKSTPVESMVRMSADEIRVRSEKVAKALEGFKAKVVPGTSSVGGGSAPGQTLDTFLIEISLEKSESVSRALLSAAIPVAVRKSKLGIAFDLRTVSPTEEVALVKTVREALSCLS